MSKIKKTFSLESETIQLLEQIAKNENLTQSKTLKCALNAYYEALKSKQDNNDNNDNNDNEALIFSLQAHIKDLQTQINVKDKQINALNENLKAQQTISALISPNVIKSLSGANINKAPRSSLFSKLFMRNKNK